MNGNLDALDPAFHSAFASIEQEVALQLATVRDVPQQRLQRRRGFYRQWGFGNWARPYGFGSSELSFMEWEIQRGLLNSLHHPSQPGSAYWRCTNEAIITDSEVAALCFQRDVSIGNDRVQTWVDYFRSPDAARWYRAHTTSLVHGMIKHRATAVAESRHEQRFINAALFRLLDAEALVCGAAGDVGRWIADPRGFAVKLAVSTAALYPVLYPLPQWPIATSAGLVRWCEQWLRSRVEKPTVREQLVRLYLRPMVGPDVVDTKLQEWFVHGGDVYPQMI